MRWKVKNMRQKVKIVGLKSQNYEKKVKIMREKGPHGQVTSSG